MHEDDVDKTVEALTDAAIGKRDLKIENRYRCKDGSFIWVDWNVLALAEENTFYTSGRDITDKSGDSSSSKQEKTIYSWTDEGGKIHYSDKEPQ